MENQIKIEDIDRYFLETREGQIYDRAVSSLEKILIEKALDRTYGNQITAAKLLGLSRNTLYAKIKKLNIEIGRFKR